MVSRTTDYIIVPSEQKHIGLMAEAIREEDASEARALGLSVKTGLWRSYRRSILCRSAFVEGEIAAMWGLCGTLLSDEGTPWLVTSAAVERAPLAFVKEARREVAQMLEVKRKISNVVPAEYTRAVGFLRLVGFEMSDPHPFGPDGVLFHTFSMGL